MDERSRGRAGITVTGSGSAAASVDQVTMVIAVVQTRADAGEAFRAAAHTATQVLAVLADDGADARMVRTTDLTLGPRTDWHDGTERILGYQAAQRLLVQLTALSGLERMLSDVAATDGGGVRIDSVTLTPTDPAPARREARAAAMDDARARAEQLADLAGRRLGEVSWVRELPETGGYRPAAVALARHEPGMPVATGDATVSVAISVHWSFAD